MGSSSANFPLCLLARFYLRPPCSRGPWRTGVLQTLTRVKAGSGRATSRRARPDHLFQPLLASNVYREPVCIQPQTTVNREVCLRFVLSLPPTTVVASSREGSAEQGISSYFPEGNESTLHCPSAGGYQHGFPSSGPGGNQNSIQLCKGNKVLLFIALYQGFLSDPTHYWKNNNLEEIIVFSTVLLLA